MMLFGKLGGFFMIKAFFCKEVGLNDALFFNYSKT